MFLPPVGGSPVLRLKVLTGEGKMALKFLPPVGESFVLRLNVSIAMYP